MLHDPVDYTVIGVGALFCAIHVSDLFDSGRFGFIEGGLNSLYGEQRGRKTTARGVRDLRTLYGSQGTDRGCHMFVYLVITL